MKKVLVLGAGMVSRPMIRYLLQQGDMEVTMASRTVSKAEGIINGHERGRSRELDVSKEGATEVLDGMIREHDLTVSLLPYVYHVQVAKHCIKNGKDMVTTSYISPDMRELDREAREANILILNECGVDPGIDHMSAMRVIHQVEERGGRVLSFRSSTGALPAHEANNNPFGYKFSWAPRGVLLACKNPARWLEQGKEVNVPGEELFEHYYIQDVPGIGSFENYPNRNAIPYKELYGLEHAHTVYRGTFRMTGWCETIRKLVSMGWLSEKKVPGFEGKTYGDLTRTMIDAGPNEDLEQAVANYLGIDTYSAVIKRLKWLGLFGERKLPEKKNDPLDYLNVITLDKMALGKDERDMILMVHQFLAEVEGKKENITSTLISYGEPGADSAIARTVSLPAAMAVKNILNGKIDEKGVHIPIRSNIYGSILKELEGIGIKFRERTERI